MKKFLLQERWTYAGFLQIFSNDRLPILLVHPTWEERILEACYKTSLWVWLWGAQCWSPSVRSLISRPLTIAVCNTLSRLPWLPGAWLWQYIRRETFLSTLKCLSAGSYGDSTLYEWHVCTRTHTQTITHSVHCRCVWYTVPDSKWAQLKPVLTRIIGKRYPIVAKVGQLYFRHLWRSLGHEYH